MGDPRELRWHFQHLPRMAKMEGCLLAVRKQNRDGYERHVRRTQRRQGQRLGLSWCLRNQGSHLGQPRPVRQALPRTTHCVLQRPLGGQKDRRTLVHSRKLRWSVCLAFFEKLISVLPFRESSKTHFGLNFM